MRSKVLILFVAGFFFLGVSACTGLEAAPPPATPTTFFSALTPDAKYVAPVAMVETPTDAPTAVPTGTAAAPDIARPSNPGGPGPAVGLTGNVAAGQVVFQANCVRCHGQQGKGSIANPGSNDGTVPALNPIDSTLANSDYKTFATNLDLFVEHGSAPAGPSPILSMPAWGDSGKLKPQQIADVIAYVISLNK